MSSQILVSLFAYKSWANKELYSLLKSVSDEHGEKKHSCVRFLNHIYVVDKIFQAHLRSEPHGYEATNTKDTPSLLQLENSVIETDAWFEQYVASLDIDKLNERVSFTFIDGQSGQMSRQEILLHVITHGGYHRGNVGELLRSISVAPPKDIFTRFLHMTEPERRVAA